MFASPAYAQAAGAAGSSSASTLLFVGQFALLGLVFYFLLIRPQQKRAKEHRATIESVKKGDSVVTAGGLIGRVTRVDDAEVELEIAASVRVRVVKATLSDVRPAGGAKPAND
jgi:preprotein translocase subunit YajC